MDKIVGVKGMNDLMPEEMVLWERLEDGVSETFRLYGYAAIRTPILEPTALFVRGIGEATDIVEKEMYSFTDALNGERLTLRPENTAAVVRAAIEHNLLYDGPRRLCYFGPMFRHERPQKGRYRQFHQFGVEALGMAEPEVDAEQLLMIWRLWERLGIAPADRPQLQLNSLGTTQERLAHREALVDYLGQHQGLLDDDARRRLQTNPLRILDTKNPAMAQVVESAPLLSSFLGEASCAHQDRVCQALRGAGVPFVMNPRLVRGLDYYNLTVFEWVTDRLGAQGTVCAGGRYDGLMAQMGGKPAPACGLAIGAERLLALLGEVAPIQPASLVDVYLVSWGDQASPTMEATDAIGVAEKLRSEGLRVLMHVGGQGVKSQMKKADSSGAAFAVLLGEAERAAGQVTLKPLRGGRDGQPQQEMVPLSQAIVEIQRGLNIQRSGNSAG
ncbi:MAG: histidine--tRNA ligase [Burkholderiaceae bacterium]|jgi:histidyl-tRNA synthetase|nr:histidine--tRNA ligase [Burkholderiaceae bacterium]MDP4801087.1 histidine--tRNA ligase [Burkholderiaceae bacterium]